jgi:hypothetical protein
MCGLYKKELFKLLKIFNNKFIDILDAVILVHESRPYQNHCIENVLHTKLEMNEKPKKSESIWRCPQPPVAENCHHKKTNS